MIPFVSLNVAGIKDNASKNNSKKQEDAGLIISIKPITYLSLIIFGKIDLFSPLHGRFYHKLGAYSPLRPGSHQASLCLL
jgi:hypothetical protein